jgi:autophagy-related protein 2
VGGAVGLLLAVPWGGVALRLPRVQLGGVAGWGALLSAVGGAWGADVAATQAHKFVRGVPVVRPLVAAGAGAAQLLSAPVATLRQERQRRALRGAARGALAVRALMGLRPMPLPLTRPGAPQFARTLGAEARAVQRTVAAGGRAALQAAADAASAAVADRAFR